MDWAPRHVGYHGHAVVTGHVISRPVGKDVSLQLSRGGASWRTIAHDTTDASGRVRYVLDSLGRSATVRLVRDGSSSSAASDSRRIGVRPRLALDVTPLHVYKNKWVKLSGHVSPDVAGRTVLVQKRAHHDWRTVRKASVGDGSFAAWMRARHTGNKRVRVKFRGDRLNSKAAEHGRVHVYRPDPATWYGPGFYGHRTACGQILSRKTLGVANRHLPCGTKVAILYRGRTVTVPVVDRGPYSSADWDLTRKTAARLDFSGRGTIGVNP